MTLQGCFLGATDGSAAISIFSRTSEIASVASLLRNDIATQPLKGEGNLRQVITRIRAILPLQLLTRGPAEVCGEGREVEIEQRLIGDQRRQVASIHVAVK